MIELELTFLVRQLPPALRQSPKREILDIYLPSTSVHPVLRLRRNGRKYELTKKFPVDVKDSSVQTEETIILTRAEYDEMATLAGKRLRKIRYCYPWCELTAEIDIFQDKLAGLVLADFEFQTLEQKARFICPDWCLADVTNEEFVAGGMLCGKGYSHIKARLETYGYCKIGSKRS